MYIFGDILEFSIYRRFDHFLHSFCALCVVFRVLMIFIFIYKALIFAQLDSYLHLKYFFAQLDSFLHYSIEVFLCTIGFFFALQY